MVGRSRSMWVAFFALISMAAPAGAAQVPMPRLMGDGAVVEDGASLHARDADSRLVLWLLGHEGAESFVVAGGSPLTGVATAPNRAAIFAALATKAGTGATVVRTQRGVSKKTVTFDEAGISGRVLVERLAAASGAKGVVVSHRVTLGDVSIRMKDVPVDAAIAAVAKATGSRLVVGRDLMFVLPLDEALAELPAKKPDPAFALRVAGATAAESVALLESVGIAVDGRVPCDPQTPLWFETSEVRADEAMRALRLAAGAADAIGNGDACKPKTWRAGSPPLATGTPIASVRTSKRSAALFRIGLEAWIVALDALPKGARVATASETILGPRTPKPAVDIRVPEWGVPLASGRKTTLSGGFSLTEVEAAKLTATLIDARRRTALFEGAAASYAVTAGGVGNRTIEIEDGVARWSRPDGTRVERNASGLSFADAPASPKPPPPRQGAMDELAEVDSTTGSKNIDADGSGPKGPAESQFRGPIGDVVQRVEPPKASSAGASNYAGFPDVAAANAPVPPPDGGGGSVERDAQTPERSVRASRMEAATKPLWAVEPFTEKAGWLGPHEASLATRFRGDSWGDTFALALERALRERGRRAQALDAKLTDEKIQSLVKKELLQYVVAGDLRSLRVAAGNIATLEVGVIVRKETAGRMKVVDLRTHAGSATIAAPIATDAEALGLVRLAAEKAADAVVSSLPADLFAVRN